MSVLSDDSRRRSHRMRNNGRQWEWTFRSVIFSACFSVLSLAGVALQAKNFSVVSPLEGDTWLVGKRYDIQWNSSGYEGETIIISTNVGNLYIADEVPIENGSYGWSIPWDCQTTDEFKLTFAIGQGDSSEYLGESGIFKLAENPEPALEIRSPAGDESWPVGTSRTISWDPHNLAGALILEILADGEVVDTVKGLDVDAIRYSYTLPASLSIGDNYQARLTSASYPEVETTSQLFHVTESPPKTKKWTVMLYVDGDCNLEKDAIPTIADLRDTGGDDNLNVLVQLDRVPGFNTEYGNWYGTKRFNWVQGMTPTSENAIQDLGELSMARPDTLTDFINWAVENYPAENYYLICYNHGTGWERVKVSSSGIEGDAKDICQDYSNGDRHMDTRGTQAALQAAVSPMTILGLDTCLEGWVEIAYQFRHAGPRYMVASPYMETSSDDTVSPDWPYSDIIQHLRENIDKIDARSLAIYTCDAFIAQFGNPFESDTLAVTDLSNVDNLTKSIADLATAMMDDHMDEKKVRSQARKVKKSFKKTVIHSVATPFLQGRAYGLNINFPASEDSSAFTNYTTEMIDFPEPSLWRDFLSAYYDRMEGSWIDTARQYSPGGDMTNSVDLWKFCQELSPNSGLVQLFVGPYDSALSGATIPNDHVLVEQGETITIQAEKRIEGMVYAHFVRWLTSGNVAVADPMSSVTTATINGDAQIKALYYEDRDEYTVAFKTDGQGGLDGETEQTVAYGGACSSVTAAPDSGCEFACWTGDVERVDNPLIVTNVLRDMNITAIFIPQHEKKMERLKISLSSDKASSDSIKILRSAYPAGAPDEITSATVIVDGVSFDCPSGSGWRQLSDSAFEYRSPAKVSPEIHFRVDVKEKIWSFSVARATVGTSIDPYDDGVVIILKVNDQYVGKFDFAFDSLNVRSKIDCF